MDKKRITIFAGHYGSGKTTIALNYAVWLKKTCPAVVICDLDIVNPYFRTLDGLDFMNAQGINIISSKYANTNVDLPSIPPQAQSVFDDRNIYAVIDLGGDDRGALAMGRYSEFIHAEKNYEMLLVMNKYRPLTRDPKSLILIKEEIEKASGVTFTGIVNNSNLGAETRLSDIRDTIAYTNEIAELLALPVKVTTIKRDILDINADLSRNAQIRQEFEFSGLGEVFPVELISKAIWKI